MQIPTMRVRVLATDHECAINVSDFDPALHADLSRPATKAKGAPPVPPGPVTPPAPDAIAPASDPKPAGRGKKAKG